MIFNFFFFKDVLNGEMKSETEHNKSDPSCCNALGNAIQTAAANCCNALGNAIHKSRLQFSEKTCQDIVIAKKNWISWEYMLHYHNIHLGVILRRFPPRIVGLYSRVAVLSDSLSILMVNGLYVLSALEGNDNIDTFLTGVFCMLTI